MPRHRRNPLPKAPPKRRFAGQPSPQQLSSSLARVRKMSGQLDERDRPFSPERPGSWRGSSRDLVVNPKDSSSYGTGARLRPGYAFEGPDVPNKELIEIPNDDWETVMISEDDCEDTRFVQYLTIDGARCSVFERKSEPYGYLAQMSHMARNGEVDPRDIPAHLHGAELRDEPEHNGQDVGYSQGMRGRSAEWFQVEYATGSDYSGGSVNKSNYQVLSELLEEHHPEEAQPVVWARTSGGHGTYGIVVRYGDLEDEVRESIDALEDYPLMDEEHHSGLEVEEQGEAWESWGKTDFIRALAKDLNFEDWDDLEVLITPDQWYAVFSGAAEAANVYWEDQEGAGQWIDMPRVAKKAGSIVTSGKLPQHSNDYQDDAFEALIAALPEEK